MMESPRKRAKTVSKYFVAECMLEVPNWCCRFHQQCCYCPETAGSPFRLGCALQHHCGCGMTTCPSPRSRCQICWATTHCGEMVKVWLKAADRLHVDDSFTKMYKYRSFFPHPPHTVEPCPANPLGITYQHRLGGLRL